VIPEKTGATADYGWWRNPKILTTLKAAMRSIFLTLFHRLKILIVDDNMPFRSAVSMMVKGEPSMEVVGEADTGMAAVRLASELSPDVVLMDVHMPGPFGGVEATRRIVRAADREGAGPMVIGFSAADEERPAMLEAGAIGFIPKSEAIELIDRIKGVMNIAS
jgi:DNA-binding NarL/FixJ family response regulator